MHSAYDASKESDYSTMRISARLLGGEDFSSRRSALISRMEE